jgi:cytoskeletal protein CcmA (bactofilin family)
MSSWRKYGGTNHIDGITDLRVNSLVTNYFTILKQITNDIDISGNLIVQDRLNVYGDVSFNQDLTVEGNVHIYNDLDVSGNVSIYKNLDISGNLTVLNHLYFQNYPTNVYMYGNDFGIAINKEIPEADFDICGNNPCILNVKSNLAETHNILARNKDNRGIMLSVDACNSTLGFYYDNSLNINNLNAIPDAYMQYNSGGVLHIDALDHVQIVSNLIVTDNSANVVNDAVLTVYNDLENDKYLYYTYDVSSVYTGTAICGVAVDASANISINLITKNSELGGAIYGGAYPKNIKRAMLSLGTTDFSNHIYNPAQTIVEGVSNVKFKNTTGINKSVPVLDRYSLDINGGIHIENIDITTTANIDFDIRSMRFSRQYNNTGIVVGNRYKENLQIYSQKVYVTKDGGSKWEAISIVNDQPGQGDKAMNSAWVYDNQFLIVYGDNGNGYCLDISNNIVNNNKQIVTGNGDTTKTVKDIFACDFSGNKNNKNALTKVFFIMTNSSDSAYQLRYFNAAFGESATAYANTNYVNYTTTDNTPINDNTSPLTYYRNYNVTGRCIDGAGFFINTDLSNSGYIYIAGDQNIRKYLFSGISTVTEVQSCAHNVDASYNAISVVDMSNVFAVGRGFISHTVDGGNSWIDISRNTADLTIQNTVLRSVWAYDASNAIAVGYKGAIVYTTNGYTWKNAPKNLFDLSGTGFPLVDASLNNVFSFNKNDFILATNNQKYHDQGTTAIGYGKVIYNHVPDLLNSQNNSVLDLCGNMTIAGDIILDRPNGNITSTGTNLYVASNTPNIYMGNGTNGNIYLGNSDPNSTIYFLSKTNFGKNLRLDGGFEVTGGNILIDASYSLVSYGLDVSYGNIDILTVDGGTQISRGQDLSYSFHVKGYRPAARIDASLSVNQLYVDASSVLLGPMISTYKSSNGTYTTDPAISVSGYSKFGPKIAIDGSNGLITLSNAIDVSNGTPNSYGGLYLSNGTGAFIDGNVYIAKNIKIGGVVGGYPLQVTSGTSVFKDMLVEQSLTVYGSITTSSNLTVYGGARFISNMDVSANVDISGNLKVKRNVDISGNINLAQALNVTGNITNYASLNVYGPAHFQTNIDVSGNVDISGNLRVQGTIYGSVVPPSDYRIKTNVQLLSDTSFNIDRLVPKYYYNTFVKNEEIGFIAHEIQEQYPFLVAGIKDGPEIQGVNYTGLIGLLVKEIQDLKGRVSLLESYTVTD